MARHEQSEEPVTVLETVNPAVLAVAKSLLEEANIPFFAKGEVIQNLGFGIGAGPVELQVSADDAEQARALLMDLDRNA